MNRCLLVLICFLSCSSPKNIVGNDVRLSIQSEEIEFDYNKWYDKSEVIKNTELCQVVESIWQRRKQYWKEEILNNLINKRNVYVLYNIQVELSHMLYYAERHNRIHIYSDCAELMLMTLGGLEITNSLNVNLGQTIEVIQFSDAKKIWLQSPNSKGNRHEIILCSSQFLYAAAQAVNLLAKIKPNRRTTDICQFLLRMTPVIVEHYIRWIFESRQWQVQGWRCSDGTFTHSEFIERKFNKIFGNKTPWSYCNAVTAHDLWICAGLAELLSSDFYQNNHLPHYNHLNTHLFAIVNLITSRISITDLENFDGESVQGVNFDVGAWDDHPDHAYQGFTQKGSVPTISHKQPIRNASWDFSHASRFVYVFSSLAKNKNELKYRFPDKIMENLSNQVSYKVFNRDLKNPLFNNYFDGKNGWYRVNYTAGTARNTGPYKQSRMFLSQGYLLLSAYNDDIAKIGLSVLDVLDKGLSSQYYPKYIKDTHINDRYYSKSLCLLIGLS